MAMNIAEMAQMKIQKHVEVHIYNDCLPDKEQYSDKLNDTKKQQYSDKLNNTK